ncbi:type II toxin-antitoxin system PemK/MazF family toxin [Nafulsella turpanensis]|uniref:type II toxin-antitoxin system PemK/MazF family toxin n=1 Tax=Nafulsella turpanensis TaxID=1265690 RepID=UPI00034BF617|nr:type II toxin-antitoxin system PemK/MazF family toxin [Nafulsella turpanensis]
MKKGDIVLIPFPFTDLTGAKNRPALILIDSDEDITVSFITTQLKWQEKFDVRLEPSKENGLKKTSLIRLAKITTIDKELVIGKLGQLTDPEMEDVNRGLIALLGLK